MNIRNFLIATLIVSICIAPAVAVSVYTYQGNNTAIGFIETYRVKGDESLIEIARRYDLGYNEITDANPDLDPFLPGNGTLVVIPVMWVLPDVGPRNDIVVNLSEMRLYYFFKNKGLVQVRTFPVGIGSEGYGTPAGKFMVIEKMIRPSWHVPESIRKENPKLPLVVPPGRNNPLGSHALRLSLGSILIHGTNKPYGVGRRVSHGCIRMYPEDISKLFKLVPLGAAVTIVRQPIKIGTKDNKVYIEVHRDDSIKEKSYFSKAVDILRKNYLLEKISTEKLYRALNEKRGIPLDITN